MENQRVALVTGAGRGIGRACALLLAEQGCRVAAVARSGNELEQLVDEIVQAGGEAIQVVSDLSDPSQPAHVLEQVRAVWGPVNVLVNNAGVGSSQDPKALVEFDDAFWELTFAVNVHAPYRLMKHALPAMVEAGWGRVINIASINAKVAAVHGSAYTASKHALAGLTRAAAVEMGGTGVTVNAVCPGVTRSLLNDLRLEYDAERLNTTFEELERQASPLGRRLDPEEIASMVAYLAKDEARAVQGQLINVCGGRVMF